MAVDQAAGLRRRRQGQLPYCIHCVSDSAECAVRLARALHGEGRIPLVVDARGRLLARTAAHTLFDWTQQLERGRLLALPIGEIAVWQAPGARADATGLAQAAREYDVLVFDSPLADAAAHLSGAPRIALLPVRPDTQSAVYALLKTLAMSGGAAAILFGDARACARVHAACVRFLGATLAAAIDCVADEDDAIAALAVRMVGEELGCHTRYQTGNT